MRLAEDARSNFRPPRTPCSSISGGSTAAGLTEADRITVNHIKQLQSAIHVD